MFCPYCGAHFSQFTQFCCSCGRSLELLRDTDQVAGPSAQVTSKLQLDSSKQKEQTCPSYKQFIEYRSSKSRERQSFSYGSKLKCQQQSKPVQINIGLMVGHGTELKPLRGKTLPLFTNTEITAQDLLKQAVQKMRTFNKDLGEGPYVLLYPDCTEVVNVPGTERPFRLADYKKEIGKTYPRITFFICPEEHFKGECTIMCYFQPLLQQMIPQTLILKLSSLLEAQPSSIKLTLWFLNHKTTVPLITNMLRKKMCHNVYPQYNLDRYSGTLCQPGVSCHHCIFFQIVISDTEDLDPLEKNNQVTTPYSKYSEMCAPYIEEDDEELVEVASTNVQHTAKEDLNITLPDIIANLSHTIDHGRVSRFNISRANVWDGAIRGFRRSSYSETCDMLVKFTDDAGVFEEGLDTGGPKREFLSLLMKHLKDRPIFDGPEGHRFLVYNANAVREDEYFLAGKMIAVSVVHGGPGPHFLSEDLVHYLAGQASFKATVASVTDEGIGKALQEIENAASVDVLRECVIRHSTMLQTAGCLRHVSSVEEKKDIVSDYLRWYIIDRNSSALDRFKDGLSALHFLDALQQHPTMLSPVLCHIEKKLTALELEQLFKPNFSPVGSNRRLLESQTMGYWADYLLDCEGL
ncbi:uncharacterized protein LOC119782957 isoform X1 [Cyprinodon tularosa]|uniref:uncharacterized protein LOC119782957 isoform X1 n=1 Tax=Cyprinodon tularosa TaxID=77115 RepID=UPI0018E23F86|nr:uncharacterized protein LOC119782957 isoform X1 [Cyprinodon tularosa]